MDKANLYVTPPSSAYLVMKPFEMPISNGSIWAISFTSKNGRIVTAALSVVYTLIFTWLWSLVVAATIYFAPHRFSRRRLVALVALRNTSSPLSALQALANFTSESMGCFGSRKHKISTWRDTLFGLLFAILCLLVIVAGVSMGILGPAFLQIGNVAPVASDALFYPKYGNISAGIYRTLRADPSLRALSSVQVFSDAIGPDVVQVLEDEAVRKLGTPEQPMFGLNYSYKITGAELGLKDALDLALTVTGACRTEYNWLDKDISNQDLEFYTFFGEPYNNLTMNLTGLNFRFQPRATFRVPLNQTTVDGLVLSGNMSYAVLVSSALRNSGTVGTDPWYLTEPHLDEIARTRYRIKRGRPVLSCWHQDTWSCGGQSVNGGFNLKNLAPLKVKKVLQDVLGVTLLYPPIQRLGEDAGYSALQSLLYSHEAKDGVLDAGRASIYEDMKRLISASYISTLNILVDTTRYKAPREEMIYANWFYKATSPGQEPVLQDGSDGFVVHTPDVATFSLTGLIVAACFVFVLMVLKLALTIKLFAHRNIYAGLQDNDDLDPNLDISPVNKDRWARFRAFSAIHLLRNTYEDGSGVPAKDWQCGDGLPEPMEDKPLLLVRCKRGEYGCAGHIATQPSLLEEGRELQQRRRRRRSKLNSVSTLLSEADLQNRGSNDRADKTQSSFTVEGYTGYSSTGSTPNQAGGWLPDVETGTGNTWDTVTNYFSYQPQQYQQQYTGYYPGSPSASGTTGPTTPYRDEISVSPQSFQSHQPYRG